jgi:RNA polymerase sigma-70 factor, ECF subfamily
MQGALMQSDKSAEQTDRDLIARCREQRDQLTDNFEQLYQRYADAVFGFLISLLRDREKAEDALQEAFFRAYSALDRFDVERSFRPWIFRIARNVAMDSMRQDKKVRAVISSEVTEGAAVSDDTVAMVARKERKELVHKALDALPMEERSVLIMKHFQGLTVKQIAEVLCCSLRTAKYRLKGAAVLLGTELSRREITNLEVI